MKVIKIASIFIIIVIIGSYLVFSSLVINVPVGWVGVRTQQYAVLGGKGVAKEDFGPGWHRKLGPIDTWVMFDSTVQTLEMTRDPSRGSRAGRDDVRVQSADGYTVSVDVTIKYKIAEGKAYKLYQDTGSGIKYKTIVRNEAEEACISLFGQMKTEEFYNSHVRRAKAKEVLKQLQEFLKDNYVQVIEVLIRDVQFDPEYENKIRRKKLADQDVELNKSLGEAKKMAGKTQVIEADTRKKVAIITEEMKAAVVRMDAQAKREITRIKADADKYFAEKKADADLLSSQKQAKGNLLIKEAEAKGERLRNAAMSGAGGSVIVALEAARNLNITDITISTLGTDVLDIDAMATKLGVPKK